MTTNSQCTSFYNESKGLYCSGHLFPLDKSLTASTVKILRIRKITVLIILHR